MYKDVVVAQKFCTRKIEQCFEDVSKVFHRSLKSTSRKFQRWLSQVVGVLQVCFKEISRNLEGVLRSLMMFYDSFKVSSSMFHLFFKFFNLWVFHGNFKELGGRFKFFNDVSWQFQGKFKYVSSLFQVFLINFFECFMDF